MQLSKAIEGFALYCVSVRKRNQLSVDGYICCLDRLTAFTTIQGIKSIEDITPQTLRTFFHWLETEYEPGGWNSRNIDKLSSGTIRKTWIVLRSFYNWASSPAYGIGAQNIMAGYPAPKAEQEDVEPFSPEEVKAILSIVEPSCCKTEYTLPNTLVSLRNRAIIHVLLDVGLRNAELRNLKIADWTTASNRLHIRQGKGNKDRYVYLGKKTNYILWQYVNSRPDTEIGDWLFPLRNGDKMSSNRLAVMIRRIGIQANVSPCYPHRFRHTCAVMRVMLGQSVETLMHLLGHTNINTTMRYVNLARQDTSRIQRTASPIDNL